MVASNVDRLLEQLGSGDADVVRSSRESFQALGRTAWPELIDALAGDGEQLAAVLTAISYCGGWTESFEAPTIAALGHASPWVRYAACLASALGPISRFAPRLTAGLHDEVWYVRSAALEALLSADPSAPAARDALEIALDESSLRLRNQALDWLAEDPRLLEGLLSKALECAKDSDWHVRSNLVALLKKRPMPSTAALATLRELIADENVAVRGPALRAAARSERFGVDELTELVANNIWLSDPDVRRGLFSILLSHRDAAEAALIAGCQNEKSHVRYHSLLALRFVTPRSDAAWNILGSCLASDDDDYRLAAAAVAWLHRGTEIAHSILADSLSRLALDRLRVSLYSLFWRPTTDVAVLNRLAALTRHADGFVAQFAVAALARSNAAPEGLRELIAALRHEDEGAAIASARRLASSKWLPWIDDALPALQAAEFIASDPASDDDRSGLATACRRAITKLLRHGGDHDHGSH